MRISVEIMAPVIHETIEGESEHLLKKIRTLQKAFADLDIPDLTVSILEVGSSRPDPKLKGTDLIEELKLSVRTYNVLKRQGVQTISALTSMRRRDLEAIQFLGNKSIEEIIEVLDSFGLYLEDD